MRTFQEITLLLAPTTQHSDTMRMAVLHVIGASLLLPAAAMQHVVEWHDLYDSGSESHEVHYTVGDSVMFRWKGSLGHNLMKVSKSAYTNCEDKNGAMLNDGSSTGQIEQVVDFPKTGEFYFLCSVNRRGDPAAIRFPLGPATYQAPYPELRLAPTAPITKRSTSRSTLTRRATLQR